MDRSDRAGMGITLGGAIVIAGIAIAIFWSLVIGIVVALVGLLAFNTESSPKSRAFGAREHGKDWTTAYEGGHDVSDGKSQKHTGG